MTEAWWIKRGLQNPSRNSPRTNSWNANNAESHSKIKKESKEEITRLYQSGFNMKELANKFNVSFSCVQRFMTRHKIEKRERSLNYPDLTMNEDLAYILGVLVGDGSIGSYDGGNYIITLTVVDKLFAQSFFETLKKINLTPNIRKNKELKKPSILPNNLRITPKKRLYVVKAFSKTFVSWYKSLTFDKMYLLLQGAPSFKKSFIRGFYESEGCLSIKNKKQCVMGNKDYDLSLLIKKLCSEISIDSNLYRRKDGININYIPARNIERFLTEINPCIKCG